MTKKKPDKKMPNWKDMKKRLDKLLPGVSEGDPAEMPTGEIVTTLLRRCRRARAERVLASVSALRTAAGAVLDQFYFVSSNQNRPLKSAVWMQLRENLAEAIAETAVNEVGSLLDTISRDDFE
jgi:hypothetical protein